MLCAPCRLQPDGVRQVFHHVGHCLDGLAHLTLSQDVLPLAVHGHAQSNAHADAQADASCKGNLFQSNPPPFLVVTVSMAGFAENYDEVSGISCVLRPLGVSCNLVYL